jgi:hypothetical protein
MHYRVILLVFFLFLFTISVFAENKLSDKLMKEINAQYPEAYIIKKEDFSPYILKHAKNIQTLISGDFDCNSIRDDALQIHHGGAIKLIAIHRFEGGKYKIIEISKAGGWTLDSLKGKYEIIVSLNKKGQRKEFYCDCESDDKDEQRLCQNYADKKSSRGCSIKLQCDAIEWSYIEKGAELFYFDRENNRYKSVITAD